MFTHIMVGTNDVSRARDFYDAVMSALGNGEGQVVGEDMGVAYRMQGTTFMAIRPRDGEAATVGNGGTIGLCAASSEVVDAAYAGGLANGGRCEGPPGPREIVAGSYGAYLRDPDGNKLCLWHVSA